MRVNEVSNNFINSSNKQAKNISLYSNRSTDLGLDRVSFKGTGTYFTMLVAKEGYKILKGAKSKAKYANELAKRFATPDTSNLGEKVVDTIFALAKSPASLEPQTLTYQAFREGGIWAKTIGCMRDEALKTLFPLVPEVDNDKNLGHAAKVALLSSLIETGEYFKSENFYDVFKDLPDKDYSSDKIFLVKKIMFDKNIHEDLYKTEALKKVENKASSSYEPQKYSPLFGVFGVAYELIRASYIEKKEKQQCMKTYLPEICQEINKKIKIASVALLSTMNSIEYEDFYDRYSDVINTQAHLAFQAVKDKLLNYKGQPEQNRFYQWYKNDFTEIPLEESMSKYEQILSKKYYDDFMSTYGENKNLITKEFNISDDVYEDLFKDYNKQESF